MTTFNDPSELAIMQMHLFNLQYYIINEAEINRQIKLRKSEGEG